MNRPNRVDPFRPLLIEALEKENTPHTQQWANRLISEHRVETAMVHGPRGGITPDMLNNQRAQLKRVTEVHTPFASNLNIIRDGTHVADHSASQFADFMVSTRRDLTQLASTPAGRDLFSALEFRPQHKVRIQDAGSNAGIRESARYDKPDDAVRTPTNLSGFQLDWPGSGSGSVVSHHTDIAERWGRQMPELGNMSPKQLEQVGMSSALALGHELVHAARAVQGMITSNVEPNGLKTEEKETVGKSDGSRSIVNIPTENELRRSMNANVFSGGGLVTNVGLRTRYGGKDV